MNDKASDLKKEREEESKRNMEFVILYPNFLRKGGQAMSVPGGDLKYWSGVAQRRKE